MTNKQISNLAGRIISELYQCSATPADCAKVINVIISGCMANAANMADTENSTGFAHRVDELISALSKARVAIAEIQRIYPYIESYGERTGGDS